MLLTALTGHVNKITALNLYTTRERVSTWRKSHVVNRAPEYRPYGLIGVSIIAAILNIAVYAAGVIESFLLWFLVIMLGFGSLYAFVGHVLVADDVTRSIGGPTGRPFQFQVALHNPNSRSIRCALLLDAVTSVARNSNRVCGV